MKASPSAFTDTAHVSSLGRIFRRFYVSPNPPVSRVASPVAAETPLNSDQVWVNTKSGKYWKPGSRYYGKTKQGEYLSEKEAIQKGYRPANGTGE
jgi:hypothetical protein